MTVNEAIILQETIVPISEYMADCVAPKCENIKNIIKSIQSLGSERCIFLERGLEVNRHIEEAQNWWEEGSKALCRQVMGYQSL